MVIIHHVEQLKFRHGLANYYMHPIIRHCSEFGVQLFFVLSGFLITYLLISEKKATGRINLIAFYLRRILRIWPVYFVVVFAAVFVFPHLEFLNIPGWEVHPEVFLERFQLFVVQFFVPNYNLAAGIAVPHATHTWSVGIEEQFYILWPVLFLVFRKSVRVIFYVLVLYLLVKIYLFNFIDPSLAWSTGVQFCIKLHIDCLVVGSIFSTMIHGNLQRAIQITTDVRVVVFAFFGVVWMLYFDFQLYGLISVVKALAAGVLIFNLAINDRFKALLEFKWLNTLGKWSYGLYMYHIAVIAWLCNLSSPGWLPAWMILPITILLSVIISGLSYNFLEIPFLKLKNRFFQVSTQNQGVSVSSL